MIETPFFLGISDSHYKWKGPQRGTGKLWFIEAVWEP